jgi:hypothetical protein
MQAEYDLLRRTFGHVDVLFDEQIRRGELRNYDVFVLAYARQVEERTLREARRFAQDGGALLVTTDSARLNENNQSSDTLYSILPATVGEERAVAADYSDTRMTNRQPFSRGNALTLRDKAEELFAFSDGKAACARWTVGRGEAILLGMPIAALRPAAAEADLKRVSNVLNGRAALVSRPADGEFSAITFLPKRGEGRIFMVFNGNKTDAHTRVEACADEDEARFVLADIVTGEKVPFTVKDGVMSFEAACAARWGRAFALMPKAPAKIAVSVAGGTEVGSKFMAAVRLLGADDQPIRSTLPFELTVKDPSGAVRDDLSGIRVADQGVYVFAMEWPVGAKKGQWTATATEKISGSSDSATWEAR